MWEASRRRLVVPHHRLRRLVLCRLRHRPKTSSKLLRANVRVWIYRTVRAATLRLPWTDRTYAEGERINASLAFVALQPRPTWVSLTLVVLPDFDYTQLKLKVSVHVHVPASSANMHAFIEVVREGEQRPMRLRTVQSMNRFAYEVASLTTRVSSTESMSAACTSAHTQHGWL
jgi:hypothetical protein